ncbi:CHAP domain-containing protein [Streptomyces sp. TP-A0356]|uniref:CHAP domain-containing protein n=1 Tax=Streptomyces sp. TP-A0356 TaxID=1359208 RepID=UPI0006E45C1F|nr:CHAP domain-containing protein [Streptomyces sp. TP-A0356]
MALVRTAAHRPKGMRTLLAAVAVTVSVTAVGAESAGSAVAAPRSPAAASATAFGSAVDGDQFVPGLAKQKLGAKIAKIASSKVGSRCFTNQMCSTDWCGYFVKWVWQKAGVRHAGLLNGYAFSAVTEYAARYHSLSHTPHVGDLVVWKNSRYGRHHVNIVVWVSADKRLIRTIGGNEGSMNHRLSRVVKSAPFDWRKGRNPGSGLIDHVYKGFVRPAGA